MFKYQRAKVVCEYVEKLSRIPPGGSQVHHRIGAVTHTSAPTLADGSPAQEIVLTGRINEQYKTNIFIVIDISRITCSTNNVQSNGNIIIKMKIIYSIAMPEHVIART